MKSFSYKSILFGIMGAFFLMGCQNSDTKGQTPQSGSEEASGKVVMTEYSDYQCPACAYFHPIVEKLKDHYGDKLEVQYRYYPLNSHQYAMLAARAAEAARNQDKFKEMHDMLFENQKQWSDSGNPQPMFVNFARKIGLDINQFENDLNAAATQEAVMNQKKEGQDKGVNSTPTFYINGEEVVTLPRTYKQFEALVDIYVKEAQTAGSSK